MFKKKFPSLNCLKIGFKIQKKKMKRKLIFACDDDDALCDKRKFGSKIHQEIKEKEEIAQLKTKKK